MNDKVKKKMKPRIFISSTFYDLKYIREELKIMSQYYLKMEILAIHPIERWIFPAMKQ